MDAGNSGGGKADPIISWGSIPGAGGSTPEPSDVDADGSSGSAYERVRGLLAEPDGPRSSASPRSEKMAEAMESFDQRWNQRPVSSLVAAGKKMADQSGSAGLNRLLGLPLPTEGVSDPGPAGSLETPGFDQNDSGATGTESLGQGGEVDPESSAPAPTDEAEPEALPFGEDEDIPLRERVPADTTSLEPASESREDQTTVITPTARLTAAQNAYSALNPLEAEIFRSQAELVDAEHARQALTRAQELALDTINNYEHELGGLRQQLAEARAEAEVAKQEAAIHNHALITKVAVLEGRLELMAAELVAARRGNADDGDDSEGGAGRELVKGHDDLRTEDGVAQLTEITDTSIEYGAGDTDLDEKVGSEVLDEHVSADVPDGDEGDGGLAQEMQRLAQGFDAPAPQQSFGE